MKVDYSKVIHRSPILIKECNSTNSLEFLIATIVSILFILLLKLV